MRNVFVDGYNVINSWPDLKKIKEYSFEAARSKLIELMQNYGAYNGYKIFVVFDAHLLKGSLEKKERMNNIIVVFTREGETADSFIERYVSNLGRKIEVCVVTSDSLEQQVTFQRGATRMSSIEFYNEVKNTNEKIVAKTKTTSSMNRLLLEDRINEKVLQKLEKIRKSR
ncbi:NYN domain-containing protein [Clostridium botulinum]|uniref:RNA-binding protein n=1 Tax=Clostridium botulinum C/D str. DC5 TaxID=1443128 RepID=A0A0A0IL61_CLOBO|nr:NYN domain-containing protein [Clostridium botulinum]KEI05049.1 RNA-binding protein [Clostridium botulinum C/D str. BKT75002]KEI11893.1 RNA-binding protein [Clostridium botulinum C/D str. BKT2873]KGM93908.1 RNA-binding protein [Clostridium botulinum D str. CCUG 7971]KGN01683.1 RNA-binding protein [Clostridium botulinum C/D str. DC5]KOC48828.1 RNA-binding protein [Clostridium botulinum]